MIAIKDTKDNQCSLTTKKEFNDIPATEIQQSCSINNGMQYEQECFECL
jgi:hypothetical protein